MITDVLVVKSNCEDVTRLDEQTSIASKFVVTRTLKVATL